MGRQVYFVQSREDELQLARLLADEYSVLAVPTRWAGPAISPRPPQELETSGLVLFPEHHWPVVDANISAVTDGSGDYHVFPWRGFCIRWNRTRRTDGNAGLPGRCYFDEPDPIEAPDEVRLMREIYSFIDRHIRRTSPRIRDIEEASPTFVGPDLCRRIDDGRSTLHRVDGTPFGLRPNPHYRG